MKSGYHWGSEAFVLAMRAAHENLNRDQRIEGSSDRSFGLVFAAVFLIVAGWPLIGGAPPRWWALAASLAFAGVALLWPERLALLNRGWIGLGVLLGKIVSPVALGVLFYGVLTPIGIVMRLLGKDTLRLKLDRAAGSYWIGRHPPGPPPDSMTNQF